ncbi:MAG: 3-oxoacyl-ACP synthase [Nocardia sp.]|nr:3-oxoacyl-ACP synthase [Nocardia sp.]
MPIAGIGVVSGYGWGREALWTGLHSGKPAGAWYPGYGPGRDEQAWVALVPEGAAAEADTPGPTRFVRAMRYAVREAVDDATGRGWRPGAAVGLIHASVLDDVRDTRQFNTTDQGRRRSRDFLRLLPSTPNSVLMQEFGFHGPAMNISVACSSVNAALITARMWLDQGMADDVVCVSTDLSATPEMLQSFVDLGVAVSDADPLEACRPFQEGSRGFTFGEAAVAFVLSRAVERPYCAVLGGALNNDAYHVASVDPGYEQIMTCNRQALDRSRVDASEVTYYNAHGPGTAQCDAAESAVLEQVFGNRPHLLSVKPLVGHCMSAAAGVEIIATVQAYERGTVPASPVVAKAHPRLLDGPAPFEGGITVKSSLGLGGNNSAVVLGPVG